MPRRGGAGYRRPAPRPSRPPAVRQPQPPAPVAPQAKQPSMMANIASTAAGVAIGSAVGHTIGAAMSGGTGGQSEVAPAPQQQEPMQMEQQNQSNYPCQFELKQFLDCSQNQSDISLCYGFNEALKECRTRQGGQQF